MIGSPQSSMLVASPATPQIAGLDAEGVSRIEQELQLQGAISRDNWIEQAKVLSVGGATVYSARRALGDVDLVEASEVAPAWTSPAPSSIDQRASTVQEAGQVAGVAAASATATAVGLQSFEQSPTSENASPEVDEVTPIQATEPVEERIEAAAAAARMVVEDGGRLPTAAGTDGSASIAAQIQTLDAPTETDRNSTAFELPSAEPIFDADATGRRAS